MRARAMTIVCAAMLAGGTYAAQAQMVDVPIYSNGILGQQALRNTYDNYNRANGIDPDKNDKAKPSEACSADALPAADRRRMEREYMRRARADGKASADAWVREQGRRFHLKLVADGICPQIEGSGKKVADNRRAAGKELRTKDGRICTRTRLENRPIANVGGGAMTMGMVPVCAD